MGVVVVSLVFNAGCARTKVQRKEVKEVIDLSGQWNDTDSRLVAEEMIKDCVGHPWVSTFNKQSGRDPVVIVGLIKNNSDEHINSGVFIKELERTLLNSGKVKFVASRDERPEVREERQDQQTGWTAKKTIKPIGEETGADFMVIGSINSIKDETPRQYAVLYQVNLELIDMTTNEKVWIGQKELKKLVTNSKFSL